MADTPSLEVRLRAIDELTPVMAKAVEVMATQTNALVSTMEKLADGQKKPKEETAHLNTGMVNLASTMHVVTTAVEFAKEAWEKIEHAVEKAIEEAEEAEKAERRLSAALVATGKYTEENIEKIEAYAEAIKKQTGYSDEQVKVMVATGIQMGLSIDKAEQLEEASRRLALATGKDVNEAFSVLTATVAGQSRGLARILPQVKELTEAQLKSGAAADLVNKMFASLGNENDNFATVQRKVQTAINDVYKAFGEIIIQNPVIISGMKAFADILIGVAKGIGTVHAWVVQNKEVLKNYGEIILNVTGIVGGMFIAWKTLSTAAAFVDALSFSIKLYGVSGTLAANGINIATLATTGLKAAVTFLTGPIGLCITAAAALTAIFIKWPGMMDQIIGGFKGFAGMAIEAFSGILGSAAKLAGVFNKDLAASMNRAKDSMQTYADKLQLAGVRQIEAGEATNKAKDMTLKAVDATEAHSKAIDENNVKLSEAALANLNHAKSYAGIAIGSELVRENLKKEIQDRDQDLQKFQQYLEAKKRLAISKSEEQQLELAKVRSKEVGGGGGEEATKVNADLAVKIEQQKQKQLKQERDSGLISKQAYDEQMFQSEQRSDAARLNAQLAGAQARADAMMNGPDGFEAQKQIRQTRYDAETADLIANGERKNLTEDQLDQIRAQRKSTFQKNEFEAQKTHDQMMVDQATQTSLLRAQALGDTPEALALKQQADTQAFQMKVQQMQIEAAELGNTQAQIDAAVEQAKLEHDARMNESTEAYWNRQADLNTAAGNDWQAFLDKKNAAAVKNGEVLGALKAAQDTVQFKASQKALGDLSTLMSSSNKKMFEVGKAAALANAVVNTAMAVVNALAVPPFPLGVALAAAAGAAGLVQIQKISSQNFSGGQADSGMDSVAQNLDGKSFVLSAGERVVQPTANQDLTAFLNKEKLASQQGGGGKGNTFNINIDYNGMGTESDARKLTEIVIKGIREASERGQPVMSSKGLTS